MNAFYSSRCIDSNKKKSRDITKEYVLRHFCESFSTQNLCSCPKLKRHDSWNDRFRYIDGIRNTKTTSVVFTILLHMWEVYIFCVDIIF